MGSNVVECDVAEKEESCVCKGGATLAILQEVQRCYEQRIAIIERMDGPNKLQMQVEVLRAWVGDLAGQNSLLARAVQELEAEATERLLGEKRRHAEREKKRKLCGNNNEMKILNDTLQKENIAKDREIRRLNKDVQHYEQAIIKLRNELSASGHYNPNVSQKDAEVMAGMCCTGNECGDWEPVRETSYSHEELAAYQERLHKMEADLKASSASVRMLRKMNVSLSEEVQALRRACAALQEQCRAAALHTQFKEDIIREMRRQLNQAKNKLKELSELHQCCVPGSGVSAGSGRGAASYDSVTIACVRRARPPRHDGSGDDALSMRPDSD